MGQTSRQNSSICLVDCCEYFTIRPCSYCSRGLFELKLGAGWSSPVARQAHNLKVVGSNPTPATNFFQKILVFYNLC